MSENRGMRALAFFFSGAATVFVATTLAAPVPAAEQQCTHVTVTTEPPVVERWPSLAESVRLALTERSDIDRCARAHLGMSGEGITLEVMLNDGRSTVRRLSSADDVLPALEALLLVPAPAAETARRSSDRKTKPAPLALRKPAPAMSEFDTIEQAEPRDLDERDTGVGFLFSVGGGARVGDGQTSDNLGAMARLLISDWFVGIDGRAVTYEVPVSDRIPQSALELTALGGYRLGEGTLALDLMLGPTLVVQQDMEVAVSPPAEHAPTTVSRVVPRMFFGTRLTLGARSVLGGFVGIEGAAGPSGERRQSVPPAPPLPEWMLGFVVGATVGIL